MPTITYRIYRKGDTPFKTGFLEAAHDALGGEYQAVLGRIPSFRTRGGIYIEMSRMLTLPEWIRFDKDKCWLEPVKD